MNETQNSKQINCLQILEDPPIRMFLEDLLNKYWQISELPKETIPLMFNILAEYNEEPEYALHVVQQSFPDLTRKDSDFYNKYQNARSSKYNTYSKALLPYIKENVILDLGGENTNLVELLIAMNPAIEKAYVTDINNIWNKPKHPKIEFLLQQKPDATPLPQNSIDTVIMSTVLHHIEPQVRIKLLLHVWDILKEGGRIIVVEDSFPEKPSLSQIKTNFDERFHAFSNVDKLKILSFLDWWGNRLMKNSKDIPLPCSFNSIETWETIFTQLGFDFVFKEYLGIPEIHTHIMAPKALLVFEKTQVNKPRVFTCALDDCFVKPLIRSDKNKETLAFIPKKGVNVNLSIGGSKIQTVIVDPSGMELISNPEYLWRDSIRQESQWESFNSLEKRKWMLERIFDQIDLSVENLKTFDESFEIEGIGISWAGPCKPNGHIIGPNIEGFRFADLSFEERAKGGINVVSLVKDHMRQKFGINKLEVKIFNDGDSSALGNFRELQIKDGFLLTIGTGIGSGIVNNGEVVFSLHGFQDRLGEIGHHILFHPLQNRYFYYGTLSQGKILEQMTPWSISERLAGPGLARRFVSLLQTEMNRNIEGIHAYLNSLSEINGISFSEIEWAALDENSDLGPIVEKKIIQLVTLKALQGDVRAISFISETGYEMGLGLGTFIKEFEKEPFVHQIVLSGGLGGTFGLGLFDEQGNDLFTSQIIKGIKWSLRNHKPAMNAQLLKSMELLATPATEKVVD